MTVGWQPLWKRDALELLDHIREHDQGAGLTMPELRKQTGRSKRQLEDFLVWLEDCGAVMRVDDDYFRRWRAVREDEGDLEDVIASAPSVELFDDQSAVVLDSLCTDL